MSATTPPPPPPPPPPGEPLPQPAPGSVPQNGLGTTALIMGILQFFCLGPIGTILAIIFGAMGMKKAKRGEADNGGVAAWGFWLGIAGVAVWIIGAIVGAILVGAGVLMATGSVDTAKNSQTGLKDGIYVMSPYTSVHVNDRCSFSGPVAGVSPQTEAVDDISVVGIGTSQCGITMTTPDYVTFEVSGGVATIVGVE